MKNFLLPLFLLISFTGFSQTNDGLTLVYDLFNNSVSFHRAGMIVNAPSLKEGENVYVEIREFNPYILKATLKTKNNYSQSSDILSDGTRSAGNVALGGISQLLGGLSMGSDLQSSILPTSRGAESKTSIAIKNKYYDLADELADVEEEVNATYEQIKLIQYQVKAQNLAVYDIQALKTNSHIKPSRIKELIEEEIRYAFAKDDMTTLKIEDLLSDLDQSDKKAKAIRDYQKAINRYAGIKDNWHSLALEIESLSRIDKASLISISENIEEVEYQIEQNIAENKEVKWKELDGQETEMPKLVDIRRTYEEIQSGIFTHRFPPIQATGKGINLKIEVEKKDEDGSFGTYKTLEQTVPITGQWKISGGLGIAFSKLANEAFSYSVVDDQIVGDPLDDFVPMVASFIHAYKRTERQLNLGASFGLGFPLESGEGIRSLSFFFGPTIILGKNEKFLLTGGVMGAKARRLAGGFSVGDSFQGIEGTLPMNDNYELGYFISISYDFIK